MIPSVNVRKKDFQTGVVRPSPEGVLAIVAPSQSGTANVAAQYLRSDVASADYGAGPLVELGAYDMQVAQKPVVLVKSTATTPGAYGTVTHTGAGTSVATAGSAVPYDNYDVIIKFIAGGTIASPGATYQYSLDGGASWSAVLALGSATSITIPNTGVEIDFGSGTVLAGQTEEVVTTAPKLVAADLTAPLEALRVTQAAWEVLLVWGDADASMVSAIDSWLATLETQGKFRAFIVNGRMRNSGESESAYATAMSTAFSASNTIRGCVGADGGKLTSPVTKITQVRPTSLALAARAMATDISVDAAYKADGPLDGYSITDARGNPVFHDEYLHPGLDDLRLVSLRSFPSEGGAFIDNAPLLSPAGSDFVYLQHARVMNRACEVAFQEATKRLSKGVRKQRKADPLNNNAVYIVEEDALDIESAVNTALAKALKGRVSGAKFTLSRTDDIGSNAGATLTGTVAIAALSYIKQFTIDAKFVRAI